MKRCGAPLEVYGKTLRSSVGTAWREASLMVAALSSAHLGALLFPARLRRLYVARDGDRAGERALAVLTERGRALGVEILPLLPHLGDFNDDLRLLGGDSSYRNLKRQVLRDDATRFLRPPEY